MKDATPGAVQCRCQVSSYEINCLQHATTTKYLPDANKDQSKQLSSNYMVNYLFNYRNINKSRTFIKTRNITIILEYELENLQSLDKVCTTIHKKYYTNEQFV